ncbi:hypothetical protein OH76DRAFT_1304372, partial [Lentinus brumalis]
PCPYCPKGFATAGAFSKHRRQCASRTQAFADSYNKRKAEHDEAEEAKRARLEEEDLDEQGHDLMPVDIPDPPPSPPKNRSRSGRRIKAPIAQWLEFIPSDPRGLPSQIAEVLPAPLPQPIPALSPPRNDLSPPGQSQQSQEERVAYWDLPPDAFGTHRRYYGADLPKRDPEAALTFEDRCNAPSLAGPLPDPTTFKSIRWLNRAAELPPLPDANPYEPFENMSTFLLCEWFYNSSHTKSLKDLDALCSKLTTPGFSTADLVNFKARREMNRLDQFQKKTGIFSEYDGWRKVSLDLRAPQTGETFASEAEVPIFTVKGLQCRRLLEVIVGEVQDPRFAHQRNWFPYERYWTPPETPNDSPHPTPAHGAEDMPPELIRMISDTFDSDAMLEAHTDIQNMPRNPADPPDLEYAVLPLLLYSDSTRLANFGSASLWPIYLWIGNITKYIRGKRGAFTAQHVAYIPTLPDTIQDFYTSQYGRSASAETLRWLRCELMQKVWEHLLEDEEFKHAYKHGIVIECADGILRRLFLRFFTYSADYPEKALIIAMRHLGECPCPRCLIKMKDIAAAGTRVDDQRRSHKRVDTQPLQRLLERVRGWAFKGRSMASKAFKKPLQELSLFPIRIFVPDLMHEFELGVWKGIFNHILRILIAEGKDRVPAFNERMRNTPTFGRGTIRRFRTNVSRQSKLAARDYEAFLQVMIPAIEGLLPQEHCDIVTDLLFELANWHALAKLRLHTTVTLEVFRKATKLMYAAVRRFARTTCEAYVTYELDREAEARGRAQARAAIRIQAAGGTSTAVAKKDPKVVVFRVWHTYKYHCLGDYADCIERCGCTDCTTSQTGECEHIGVKDYYDRTNKNEFVEQLATHKQREARLHGIREEMDRQESDRAKADLKGKRRAVEPDSPSGLNSDSDDDEDKPAPSPYARYTMGKSRKDRLQLYDWLAVHEGDPAIKVYLIEHAVPDVYRRSLSIRDNTLYRQKTVSFNYTTYDMRRDQDTVNPRSHPDVLLLTSQDDEDDFPFAYARVIGVFHAEFRYTGPESKSSRWECADFLWVRWFALDPSTDTPGGFRHRRLPRITFLNPSTQADEDGYPAFGFVDPACVLRGAYIIPGWHHGPTEDILPRASIGRADGTDYDWVCYYVGMFPDREMFMRFFGGGVGHNGVGVSLEKSRHRADRVER